MCEMPPGYDPPEIPPVKSASRPKEETLFQRHTAEIGVLLFSMGPPPAEIHVPSTSLTVFKYVPVEYVTTKDWATDHATLSDRLNWLPLRTRRTQQKLILIMNNNYV